MRRFRERLVRFKPSHHCMAFALNLHWLKIFARVLTGYCAFEKHGSHINITQANSLNAAAAVNHLSGPLRKCKFRCVFYNSFSDDVAVSVAFVVS